MNFNCIMLWALCKRSHGPGSYQCSTVLVWWVMTSFACDTYNIVHIVVFSQVTVFVWDDGSSQLCVPPTKTNHLSWGQNFLLIFCLYMYVHPESCSSIFIIVLEYSSSYQCLVICWIRLLNTCHYIMSICACVCVFIVFCLCYMNMQYSIFSFNLVQAMAVQWVATIFHANEYLLHYVHICSYRVLDKNTIVWNSHVYIIDLLFDTTNALYNKIVTWICTY